MYVLASHGPIYRWTYSEFLTGVLFATVVCIVAGLLLGGRDDRRRGLGFGLWMTAAVLPVSTLWAFVDRLSLLIGIAAPCFIAPAFLAATSAPGEEHRWFAALQRMLWLLVIGLLGVMLFGGDSWDNNNDWVASYTVYVVVVVGALLTSIVQAPRWFRRDRAAFVWTRPIADWMVQPSKPLDPAASLAKLVPNRKPSKRVDTHLADAVLSPTAAAIPERVRDNIKIIRALVVIPLIVGAVFTISLLFFIALPTFVCAVLVFIGAGKALKRGGKWPTYGLIGLWILIAGYGILVLWGWGWLLTHSFTTPDGKGLVPIMLLTAWWLPFIRSAVATFTRPNQLT